LLLPVAFLLAVGCVRRTIMITSEPPGALVWLNDRELGRTPVDVEFDYYGTYDVRLVHPEHEPLATSGTANAPWWETLGLDLIAELAPVTLRSRVEWHYVLEPRDDDPDALEARARQLRSQIADPPAAPTTAGGQREP
jgi:hypothetical protein